MLMYYAFVLLFETTSLSRFRLDYYFITTQIIQT